MHSNNKTVYIATFDTPEEAHIAWYLTKKALQREGAAFPIARRGRRAQSDVE
jgi:hypothetical protein